MRPPPREEGRIITHQIERPTPIRTSAVQITYLLTFLATSACPRLLWTGQIMFEVTLYVCICTYVCVSAVQNARTQWVHFRVSVQYGREELSLGVNLQRVIFCSPTDARAIVSFVIRNQIQAFITFLRALIIMTVALLSRLSPFCLKLEIISMLDFIFPPRRFRLWRSAKVADVGKSVTDRLNYICTRQLAFV